MKFKLFQTIIDSSQVVPSTCKDVLNDVVDFNGIDIEYKCKAYLELIKYFATMCFFCIFGSVMTEYFIFFFLVGIACNLVMLFCIRRYTQLKSIKEGFELLIRETDVPPYTGSNS